MNKSPDNNVIISNTNNINIKDNNNTNINSAKKDNIILRISIKQLHAGMICAENVYNTSGLILVEKESIITQNHIFRMKLYQIFSIVIYETKSLDLFDDFANISNFSPYQTDSDYLIFSEKYKETALKLKSHMDNIGIGKEIDINELFSICSCVIQTLKSSNNLFNYLYHLRALDNFTFGHSLNVSIICNTLGKWLHFSNDQVKNLTVAGLLHDIGKIEIDQNVLFKPGKLTKDEFTLICEHTVKGYNLLKDQPITYEIKMAALQHHEKCDGSGYPFGFRDAQITDFAKIVSIADIYDAMTSDRTYHKRVSPFHVINIFETEAYTVLDSKFLYTFLENIAHNYIGSTVTLNNGETGQIIFINKNAPSKPLVQTNSKIYNLEFETNLSITDIL